MAYKSTYKIPSLKDLEWLERALKAAEKASDIPNGKTPKLIIKIFGEAQNLDPRDPDSIEELKAKLSQSNGYFISSITLTVAIIKPQSQSQSRPPQVQTQTISFIAMRQPPSPTAELELEAAQGVTDVIQLLEFIQAIVDAFDPIDSVDSKLSFDSEGASEYLRSLDEQLRHFSNFAIEQAERVTKSLRDQAVQNQEELRSQRATLQEHFEKKVSDLEQRESKLEARIKDVDLADAKTSRRRLREQLKDKLELLSQDLKFTSQTNRARIWLYVVLTFGLLVGLVLMIDASFSLSDLGAPMPQELIYIGIRAIAGSILFGGVLIFFIRWQASWVRDRTREELHLLRTSLDVERASWIVESLVEFKNEGIEEMPDALLMAVTRNLFLEKEEGSSVTAPLDDLAEILREGARSVKLRLGDHEVELDRRSIKRISSGASRS